MQLLIPMQWEADKTVLLKKAVSASSNGSKPNFYKSFSQAKQTLHLEHVEWQRNAETNLQEAPYVIFGFKYFSNLMLRTS